MVARVTAIERVSDVQGTRLNQIDDHLENTDKTVFDLGKTLEKQGVRLALIFGGISVVVTGIGLSVAFVTLIDKITSLVAK